MNYSILIGLSAIIVFIVAFIFTAVTVYLYDINPAVISVFFMAEAAIVFIIADLFIRSYYDRLHKGLMEKLRGNKYDTAIDGNEIVKQMATAINDEREANAKVVLELKKSMKVLSEEFWKIKTMIGDKTDVNQKLVESVKKQTDYFRGNIRSFEKVKAIGLEIKNTSKNIDAETLKVLNDVKKQSVMAGKGVKAIGKEIQTINELKQSIMSSTKIIQDLMEMSKQINNFVSRIAEMGKKTNLLALNAGIEAARAGEAGKSFSVVADEIKMLAMSSNKSAEEITEILKNIRHGTSEIIEMIKVTEKLEDNIKTFYNTGDIFIDIVKDVKDVEKIISNISSYTQDHYTDAELMFKILTDSAAKGENYTKLSDALIAEVDEMDRGNSRLKIAIDKLIQDAEKISK